MRIIFIIFSLLCLLSCDQKQAPSQSKEPISPQKKKDVFWTSAFSHNGRYLAVGGDRKALNIIDRYERVYLPSQAPGMTSCAAWHPNKSILATVGWEGEDTGHNHLYNYEPADSSLSEEEAKDKFDTTLPIPGGARYIAWNHDGSLLASANNDGSVSIMTEQGDLIRNISRPNAKSNIYIDWLPEKDYFMVLSDSMYMYDTAGTRIYELEHRDQKPGFSLLLCSKWHPEGRFFAVGDYGHEEKGVKPLLQFWTTEGELTKTIEGHEAAIRNMVWSPDGSRLATASDALRIFSKAGELLHTGASKYKLMGIDWHADTIVTASEGGEIGLWNEQAKRIN
jgi:WD40 repeat protein